MDKTGIKLFIDRRKEDGRFVRELGARVGDSNELLMLGNTFRDFFRCGARYNSVIVKAINCGVNLKILLLDPASEHARRRAVKEQGEPYGMEKYGESVLMCDMKQVNEWLHSTPSSAKTAIEVFYYDSTPMVFLIKTRDVVFAEFYHTSVRDIKLSEFIPPEKHTPLLVVENSSRFGRLLSDHFEYIWGKAVIGGRTLGVVYDELHPKVA